MDAQPGAWLRSRRLSSAELRSSQVVRERSLHWRFLIQCRESSFSRIFQNAIWAGAPDHVLRFELWATRGAAARRAAGLVRSDHPPAHADVSYGALRLLRISLERNGLSELRPAL